MSAEPSEKAKAKARGWVISNIPIHMQAGHVGQAYVDSVALLLDAFAEEAREDERKACAKIMCGHCSDGRPVLRGEEAGRPPLIYHPSTPALAGTYLAGTYCQAAGIWLRGGSRG